MNRLTGYIVMTVLRGTALVAVVLVAVASAIEFVIQLDDVGLASYGVGEALAYVALRIPQKLFDVLPAATLIGALLGLGNLAVHRELVVMRTSGVSHFRLLGAVGAAGALLIVVMLLLGESLAPKLGDYARRARADALLENGDAATSQSYWLRQEDGLLVNVRRAAAGELFGDQIVVFDVDGDAVLRGVAQGELVATVDTAGSQLLDFAETRFMADGTAVTRQDRAVRDYGISEDLFGSPDQRVELLPLVDLKRLISRYQASGLDATRFQTEYWSRIADGVSVLIMALLALPFVLGSLRSADAGARMIIGLVIGLGYYVLGEVSANTGQVFSLDPVVAAWAPSGALLLLMLLTVGRLR